MIKIYNKLYKNGLAYKVWVNLLKIWLEINTFSLYYRTYYGRNLRIFEIS
jgi:hypothetical protein